MPQLRVTPFMNNVYLRPDVDAQVERAFYGMQWGLLVNLARKRYKATKDEYFRALEVAALSRGDNPVDRTTGKEQVHAMVSDGKAITDDFALNLYEFAVVGLKMDFSKTIGVLRVRLVKAFPKDKPVGIRCLEICMRHTDWENAQEIAVLLTKNFPGDRGFLFQNIMTTSLVARADNTHENKKKLFPNLAKAQIDRAFNLRPTIGKEPTTLANVDIKESDLLLWIDIRHKFGSPQENLKLFTLPNWGPLFFLEQGYTQAFSLTLQVLRVNKLFEELVRIGAILLDRAISTDSLEGNMKDRYVAAAEDQSVLLTVVNAARHLPSARKDLKMFQGKIEALVQTLRTQGRMNAVYENNYARLLLDIVFAQAALGAANGELQNNARFQHLLDITRIHLAHSSAFCTLMEYIDLLNKEDIAKFVHLLENMDVDNTKNHSFLEKCILSALGLRVRFFQATSLKAGEECLFCNSSAHSGPDCETCIRNIAKSALETYQSAMKDRDADPNEDHETYLKRQDLFSSLAMVGSTCLLKLARAGLNNWEYQKESPLYHTDIQLFLQAVAWLNFCSKYMHNNESQRLLLIRMSFMMGCASLGFDLWSAFHIKNSLWEPMGTYVLDRLASISPAHVMPNSTGHKELTETILHHFDNALRHRFPESANEALCAGNYVQFQDMIHTAEFASRNCVLIMAIVEGRRAMRLKNGRVDKTIEEDHLIGSLTPDDELYDFTDYHILPQWQGPDSIPVQQLVAYGPLPTNRRCHLSLLTERFIDMICYAQPKDMKPSKANQLQQIDWETTLASIKPLQERLNVLIYGEGKDQGSEQDLTGPEGWHFRLVNALAQLVLLVLEDVIASPTNTKPTKDDILVYAKQAVKIMEYQTSDFLAVPNGIPAKMQTLHGVAALHAMGMLRESSFVTKHTVQYLSTVLDRVKSKDKARGVTEMAWLSTELKALSAVTTMADKQMKDRLKKLTDNVNTSGWVDRLNEWAFGDNAVLYAENRDFKNTMAKLLVEVIPQEDREAWAMNIADSWRQNINGWNAFKFD
ncbi:hypothetical protein GGS21DRAFT_493269 [Xylaria nigripes]|nr:hypothetical protein GGS21DRAFT_493269 [Xylaria nigripes]